VISRPVKDSAVRYLVDAGPLVGAFWAADQWHPWSRKTLAALGCEVYTTETVFAEAAHLLKPYPPALLQLLKALHNGSVRFLPVYPEHAPRCSELVMKYPARMDVGDASLVILSELYPRARLVTLDLADFGIYRRRDGLAVPLLAPGREGREDLAVEESQAKYRRLPRRKRRPSTRLIPAVTLPVVSMTT